MKYKNTKATRLLDRHDEKTIQAVWYILGNRKTAEHFDTTTSVIRGIVEEKGWKRPIEFMPILKKAIDSGKRRPEEFTHVDFSGDFIRNLFSNIENDNTCIQLRVENTIELALYIQKELFNNQQIKIKEKNHANKHC